MTCKNMAKFMRKLISVLSPIFIACLQSDDDPSGGVAVVVGQWVIESPMNQYGIDSSI